MHSKIAITFYKNEVSKLLKERLDKIMEFKKKTLLCTIICTVLALSLCATTAAGKIDGVTDISVSKEYKKWKITSKNSNFYYKRKRVRILADFKADKSFVQFHYDENGTIDLKITRNKKGKISNVGYFSKKEAEELLEDWK